MTDRNPYLEGRKRRRNKRKGGKSKKIEKWKTKREGCWDWKEEGQEWG